MVYYVNQNLFEIDWFNTVRYNARMENIDLIPLKEIQKTLKISRATLWNWIQQGTISTVRLSPRKMYVRREELERFVKEAENHTRLLLGKRRE